jgi:hypothetical protein
MSASMNLLRRWKETLSANDADEVSVKRDRIIGGQERQVG